MAPERKTRFSAIPILFALLLAVPAAAGSLCGTVRDAATSTPVANAGVFLRQTTGEYTGLYAATNASGVFCIHFVPPGTYDVEVRVDDYRVAFLHDIAVTGAVTDVPLEIEGAALHLRRPFPSPAGSSVTFSWFMPSAAGARLTVFDARGRLLGAWAGRDLSVGVKSVAWDLRGPRGTRVPAGVYYVRLESGAAQRVRRFVVLP